MIDPYLRTAESELEVWDDTRKKVGQQRDLEILRALEKSGVAWALVTPDFLASSYARDTEVPAMIRLPMRVASSW